MARLPLVEEEDLARAAAAFRRYGPAVVFFGRFLPIVRSLVSLPAGAQHMPLGRFVLLTAAGSAIWNTILVGGGYLLGTQHERLEAVLGYVDYVVYGALGAGRRAGCWCGTCAADGRSAAGRAGAGRADPRLTRAEGAPAHRRAARVTLSDANERLFGMAAIR